ncbi:MAG: DNA primase noncatalytic subunit PriX [Acidilobaceae archaeon]
MSNGWNNVLKACKSGLEECKRALEEFLKSLCTPLDVCESYESRKKSRPSYKWVEELIEKGVPDGRARLILYVISRYLVNVKKLSDEEALKVVQRFLENSCKNHNNCGKIYQTWVASTIRGVKRGGWKPWTLSKLKEKDPELYEIVMSVLNMPKEK